MEYHIRDSVLEDFASIMLVEKLAFGSDDEADLVANLLQDKTAEPVVSLLAFHNNEAIGHILFSKAHVANSEAIVYILAPLAVMPAYQNQGVGGELINAGLKKLKTLGTALVFVLGYPTYYSRHGFIPDAQKIGFPAPFPMLKKNADAWMLQSLTNERLEIYQGKVKCAEAMNKIEYWTE